MGDLGNGSFVRLCISPYEGKQDIMIKRIRAAHDRAPHPRQRLRFTID